MSKAKATVFKEYNQAHNFIFPPNLGELIPKLHLVRVVNDVVDQMDITHILSGYKGGGTSAYHPRMLLKVLFYGYSVKIYTGRRLAKALSQDIHFMWLAAFNRPDFRTLNSFRSGVLKDTIEELFKSMLTFLLDHSYIRFENYFCDGSTFGADANRHKMVWKKNAERYQQGAEEKCRELFKQIDELNAAEDQTYGNSDLEETGEGATTPVTEELIAEQVGKLNQVIATAAQKKRKSKAESLKRKLGEQTGKIDKYKSQQAASGQRSGYSRTDPDATAMKMKDEQVLPAYNVLIGSEDQFITNFSIHQNSNDGTCFPDHIRQLERHSDQRPDQVIADSIFGTEQNYELLEGKEIGNLMKFPLYHKEQSRPYRDNPFNKDNFPYDQEADSYLCPKEKKLSFKAIKKGSNKNGYESVARLYECEDCSGCPFGEACKRSTDKNRTILVNEKLERYRDQARQNLSTEQGNKLKRQRGQEVESCFGDIKYNQGFRRFHLRGMQKVRAEFGLVAFAHNLKKIFLLQRLNAAKAA